MLKQGLVSFLGGKGGKSTYGFIKGDDGESYFLLPSNVQKSVPYTFDDLKLGQRVEFEGIADRHKGKDGFMAIGVRAI